MNVAGTHLFERKDEIRRLAIHGEWQIGIDHLCPFVKNIRQTANKTSCKSMTKLSDWEASGGLPGANRPARLLLKARKPSSFFSSLHLTALFPFQFLRGSPTSWLGLLLRFARSFWQLEGRGPQRTSPSALSLPLVCSSSPSYPFKRPFVPRRHLVSAVRNLRTPS